MDIVGTGQSAVADAVRLSPRTNLRDLARNWINSLRAYYQSGDAAPNTLCLPETVMGNLQSDGKKKTKKGRNTAVSVSLPIVDDAQDQVHKARAKSVNDLDEKPIKVSFEKVQTPAKKHAPPPPPPKSHSTPQVSFRNCFITFVFTENQNSLA